MKVEVLPTERALIGYLLAKIHKVDPDLIVVSTGPEVIKLLYTQLKKHKIQLAHK